MKKLALLLTCFASFVQAAPSEEYRMEIIVATTTTDTDFSSSNTLSSDGKAIGGEFYFKPITPSSMPFAEAGFLSQSSSLNFITAKSDGDLSLDTEIKNIGLTHIISESGSIFGLERDDSDVSFAFDGQSFKISTEETSFTYGKYLSDTSAIVLTYTDVDMLETEDFLFSGTSFSFRSNAKIYNLAYRSVSATQTGSHVAIATNATFINGDTNSARNLGLGITLYPMTHFGFSFNAAYLNPENTSSTREYALTYQYFLDSKIALSAGFSQTKEDGINTNATLFSLTARL
ncbi:MAG: hypothetical protein KUG82_16230 [Pseudomonadales bacterium]|nr:hypothetical protein [Pseudomonadales bacterium]